MSRNQKGWLNLNQLPAALRRKTTPELQNRYHVIVNKGVRKRQGYKEALKQAVEDPLYKALQDNKERIQYFGTANGEGLFPRDTAERVFVNILVNGFTPDEAGEMIIGFQDGAWRPIRSIYSLNHRTIMYRRLPIQGDLPASPSIMKDFLTVDEFNALDPNLKRFYTYDTDGPAGPAPAKNVASEEGVAANHDDAKEPNSSLNENTDTIQPPTGAALAGSDFDEDNTNRSLTDLQEGIKAPDGDFPGTLSAQSTEPLRSDLEPGIDSDGSGSEETVSGGKVAAESAPLEVGTVEVNHEQMQAERKASYEQEQKLQTSEEPVNQELIDQYNKTEAAQPSSPGPIAHEEAPDTSEANSEGRV